ncbi:4'-phosphopantetheinyl transferase family protein [Paractinoplanes rishiriensis]|uniref:4'-phosphopantetheinyl transferase n=1 Tax=Paractinoplanes rishiriensis TaxID=1050105 RepID=A0A919MVS9_9ACTN|nr:4'-phosphopantetheinyl transferase superfamily protein [Actinoplanes rishiriensis]GIE93935.1 4'-phosphopantetheinyl transferase [Actinoplanes rishiriensis]
MIDDILPPFAVAVEAFDDLTPAPLFPEEEREVAKAVEKRRNEFATGRRCARAALAGLGHPPVAVPVGERRSPVWPAGVVGSITHCTGYRAAVVAADGRAWSVGVDAENNEPIPEGVLGAVAGGTERAAVADLLARDPKVCWDRLLFSAKESVYKVCFPLIRRFMEFDAAVVTLDPGGTFAARLTVPGPVLDGIEVTELSGRWTAGRGLLLTAITLER